MTRRRAFVSAQVGPLELRMDYDDECGGHSGKYTSLSSSSAHACLSNAQDSQMSR